MNRRRTAHGSRGVLGETFVRCGIALVLALGLLSTPSCSSNSEKPRPTESPVSVPSTGSIVPEPAPEVVPKPLPIAVPRAGKVPARRRGTYLGVYTPPAPFSIARVDAFERTIQKSVAITMWYQPWASNSRSRVDTGAIVAVMRRGKVPMISWEPWDPGSNARTVRHPSVQPAYRLAHINAGDYDGYIRQWAKSLAAIGGPIMLRPMHEMNGRWYPWSGTTNGNSPSQFTAAWKRLHRIFDEEGATNVTWVWSINHESLPGTSENRYAAYYPGDEYVDWTGISGFNGATSPSSQLWTPLSQRLAQSMAYLRTLKKPVVIAETATLGNGPARATWIDDAFATLRTAPDINAIVYFDSDETVTFPENWRVDAYKESIAAFRKAARPTFFVGSTPPVLSDWANSLSVEQWRFLLSFDPLY